MTASIDKQPEEAAVTSTPQKTNSGAQLVRKLTEVRTCYLAELKAGREKARANFIKAE